MLLDGPWDSPSMITAPAGHIFVSNVLNGTVARLDVAVSPDGDPQKKTMIATGYAHMPNSAALVLGPTGLAFDAARTRCMWPRPPIT